MAKNMNVYAFLQLFIILYSFLQFFYSLLQLFITFYNFCIAFYSFLQLLYSFVQLFFVLNLCMGLYLATCLPVDSRTQLNAFKVAFIWRMQTDKTIQEKYRKYNEQGEGATTGRCGEAWAPARKTIAVLSAVALHLSSRMLMKAQKKKKKKNKKKMLIDLFRFLLDTSAVCFIDCDAC